MPISTTKLVVEQDGEQLNATVTTELFPAHLLSETALVYITIPELDIDGSVIGLVTVANGKVAAFVAVPVEDNKAVSALTAIVTQFFSTIADAEVESVSVNGKVQKGA